MKKVNYIFVFTLFLLAFQLACGQSQSITNIKQNSKIDVRVENVKKQAEKMFEVVIKNGNYDKIADFAPSKAFELVGGRGKYVELLTQTYKFAAEYFEYLTWTIGAPQNLTEINNELLIIVPRELDGTNFQKVRVIQKSSMVGISTDNGKTWKFVNGTSFDKIFPSLAGKLQIPKERTFINGIEQ